MKVYQITMPDGSKWNVPVTAIARSHAQYYAGVPAEVDYAGDVDRCYAELSLPLLTRDASEVRDWASGNMNWVDVAQQAFRADPSGKVTVDFQDGWVNGEYRVLDVQPETAAPDLTDWVGADLHLPVAAKIAPARRGTVETAGKDSEGAWIFSVTPARNVLFDPQYCTHWRYLSDAPA